MSDAVAVVQKVSKVNSENDKVVIDFPVVVNFVQLDQIIVDARNSYIVLV